jgi:elongator complex protein 4
MMSSYGPGMGMPPGQGSSFVKKINTAPQLYKKQKGVKPYSNSQYAISSGNTTLDTVIGGGFPIGSIILLFEDSYSHYYSHFLKTYIGEGIVNEHKPLIIDPEPLR